MTTGAASVALGPLVEAVAIAHVFPDSKTVV